MYEQEVTLKSNNPDILPTKKRELYGPPTIALMAASFSTEAVATPPRKAVEAAWCKECISEGVAVHYPSAEYCS